MSSLESVAKSIEKYKPKLQTLKKGQKVYRLASKSFPANSLNPHYYAKNADFDPILDGSRFSPFKAKNGVWVPSSYLGQNEDVAVGEVLLRNMPTRALHFSITQDQLSGLRMYELTLCQDVKVFQLRGMGLRAFGLKNFDIIGLPQTDYPETQAFAKALYNHTSVNAASIVGLVWTSRQVDDAFAVLVWSKNLSRGWAEETSHWDIDAIHNKPRIERILSKANVALI